MLMKNNSSVGTSLPAIATSYVMESLTNNLLKCALTVFLLTTYSVCNESPSVIIVGAGVSGIAAASKLLENNITNLTILEAKNRIGGRVHTVPFGDNVVDLGAEWCHGEEGNVVFQMASQYGLLGLEELDGIFLYSTGKPLDQDFTKELQGIMDDTQNNTSGNTSVGEYVTTTYGERIQELYKNDPEKLKIASETLELVLRDVMSLEGSFSPFDPSVESDYETTPGNQNLNWKNRGYKTILDILIKNYPNPEDQLPIDDKIIFNKEVVEIKWNENKPVEVKCSDGSVYRADHVIVTVSLGVMKYSYETLFSPQLPPEKITAIQDLGFDAIGKVYLHFPNQWWQSNNSATFKYFSLFWNTEDKELFVNSSEIDKSWMFAIGSIFIEKENPNVLLAMLTGTSIPKIELMSDDEVIEGLMLIIHKFFGPVYDNITHPDAIKRHRWYTDPHVRGTYSYQTIKSRQHGEAPQLIMSKPLGGAKVLFAGEATNPIHYATVHGALESGRREADRIIALH